MEARVIAAHGRHYLVEDASGERWHAVPRGKKSHCACGDRVIVELTGASGAVIVERLPRSTLLYRSDAWNEKLIAANADQLILIVATEPGFSTDLLSRALVAAEHQGIRPLLVLNKCDLASCLPQARTQLAPFQAVGYPVLEISARENASVLMPWLANRISVLVGQSGMGKSTIINSLIPDTDAQTREISVALDSGKHTTTHATLYRLALGNNDTSPTSGHDEWLNPSAADANKPMPKLDTYSAIIDSPGLQEFGLAHLSFGEIEHGFPEFRPTLGLCKFHDCRHDAEPGCAVKARVLGGEIPAERYQHFRSIVSR